MKAMMRKLRMALVAALYLLPLGIAPLLAAVTATPVFVQAPKLATVQFLQGTDTAGTYKVLYTGGTNGSKIVGIIATSNDASASHLVTCQLARSAVSYGGVAVTVPVNAGFANAAPPVSLMSPTVWAGLPFDSDGNPFLYLSGSGDTITCTFATALTTSDVINVIAVVADF